MQHSNINYLAESTTALESGMPPVTFGLLTILPLTYITVEPPPSRLIAFVHPILFIKLANSVSVSPTEAPSLPSTATRIKRLSAV